jgi:hypothetical protein
MGMADFVCDRCRKTISLAEDERPWAVSVLFPKLAEVPLCLDCMNTVKPQRYAVLGAYPIYEPPVFKTLTEYGKMAITPEEQEAAFRDLFGPSGLGENFKGFK